MMAVGSYGEGVTLSILDGDLAEVGLLLFGSGGDLGEDGQVGAVADRDVEELGFEDGCLCFGCERGVGDG